MTEAPGAAPLHGRPSAPGAGTVDAGFCDWNAGAPVDPRVLDRFVEIEQRCPGNPASVHARGRRAHAELESARARIASALELDPDDVVFTSGGTEAANLAVRGLGDPGLPVLLADLEHPSVLEPARERGVVAWRVDALGRALVAAPDAPVGLVCLAHAQGEVGTLQPVAEAAELSKRLGRPLLVDAAQSLGRVALGDVVAAATAIVLSPHKAGGLRGHGVLCGRGLAATLRAQQLGGGQERGLRAGTQSPALAAANALAIELAVREQQARAAAMLAVRAAFLRGLRATAILHDVITPLDASVPNTLMLWFPKVDGRNLLPALDLASVQASHGSACSSGSPLPPLVLGAMGHDDASARACVRFSFGWRESSERAYDAGRRAGEAVLRLQKKN